MANIPMDRLTDGPQTPQNAPQLPVSAHPLPGSQTWGFWRRFRTILSRNAATRDEMLKRIKTSDAGYSSKYLYAHLEV